MPMKQWLTKEEFEALPRFDDKEARRNEKPGDKFRWRFPYGFSVINHPKWGRQYSIEKMVQV